MTHQLDSTFRELGLSQYVDAFVDQGFDTWETILDIQESDLDALGVKLGHRRKLQRRIANARGIAPSVSLASPLRANPEEVKNEGVRVEATRPENGQEGAGVVKRKYRRHPKPDENSPERPPSAYVLFSNKMREDLKSQNLTFTEIAKLVGENWQNLASNEKETYENQANAAKEKYHKDLLEYKKTPEYRKYAQYLQEFKEKQVKQTQSHDHSKRPKLEPVRLRHGSSSSSVPGGTTSSGSGSGSERLQGSEPPPNRKERVGSSASMADSTFAASGIPQKPQHISLEDAATSPLGGFVDGRPMAHYTRHHGRSASWKDPSTGENRTALPPLSDLLVDGPMAGTRAAIPPETSPYGGGFVAANHPRGLPLQNGNSAMPASRAPPLRHEPSSNDSSVSASSGSSFGRTPGEGPVPIHALLSDRPMAPPSQMSTPASSTGMGSPTESTPISYGQNVGPRGYGFQSTTSAFQNMKVEQAGDGDVVMTSVEAPTSGRERSRRDGLDGMNALLRAGEIVSRHGQD